MKTHPTQFGVRENSASPRPHDSRLATSPASNPIRIKEQNLSTRISPSDHDSSETHRQHQLHAASHRAATGERDAGPLLTVGEVAEMLQVPLSWIYGRMRKRSRERLPGYRLGKYWRFREAEALEWVQWHREGSHET